MDIAKQIKNGVNLAFKVADSGTVAVTLYLRNNVTFSFSAGLPEESAETPVTVKAFDIKSDKADKFGNKSGRQTIHKTLLFKTADIGNLSMYESLTLNEKVWHIGNVLDFDVNTTTVEIYREAIDV